jgi:hypothetical protein
VRRVFRVGVFILLLSATGGLLAVAASPQQSDAELPKVSGAWVPDYPPLAAAAHIQGLVTLRVSTDGKHVATFDSESGAALLVLAAKENINTWEFAPHKPTSFDIKFEYKLTGYHCEGSCDCHHDEEASTVLHLPTLVELSTPMPMECDPAVTIEKKK